MRPLLLELEGFSSFRDHTVIDFRNADLFVLTGATGSGKSSIIDAIAFALYGSVPRYDRRGLVEPVVTRGATRMRVRLDFLAGGKEYTAVRVVRLTKTGATTPEARLECDGETLASTAATLTEEATRIVGLEFEQFCRCVVLPQGDFAQLLHETASKRQEVLLRLLDAELYGRIGKRAGERSRDLSRDADRDEQHRERIADTVRRSLQDLLGRTVESLDGTAGPLTEECSSRIEALSALVATLTADQTRLQDLRDGEADAQRRFQEAKQLATALAAIVEPPTIAGLAARIAASRDLMTSSQQAHETAAADLQRAEDLLASQPRPDLLRSARQDRLQLRDLETRRQSARTNVAREQAAVERAEALFAQARSDATTAAERYQELRQQNAAAYLAERLDAGDPCPICGERLKVRPRIRQPEGVQLALDARNLADAAAADANNGLQAAHKHFEATAAEERNLTRQSDDLAARLTSAPSFEEAEAGLVAHATAEKARDAARATELRARQDRDRAKAAVDALATEESRAWTGFDGARDRVAALGAPAADRADLRRSWHDLAAWCASEAAISERKAVEIRVRGEEIVASRREIEQAHLRLCLENRVPVAGAPPRDAAIAAHTRAVTAFGQLRDGFDALASLSAGVAETREAAMVATGLARHLTARGFEEWFLEEALVRLAIRASTSLKDLSGGQFSLALSGKGSDFEVIDHGNANERRPVKSLSGGETFLASLSLALALADEVALLAPGGAARLDALFLDEGFGTLDADTLETVAAAIEDLGARGRMVGIVTHVRELADRIPVRFQVRRDDRTSHVTRVDN